MSNRTLQLDDRLYRYVLDHSLREHPAQAALREATRRHPHAGMQISPEQGQLMALLVKLLGARRTIEIGVFTGYSSTAMALAMQAIHGDDALVVGLDVSEDYTAQARKYWKAAGVDHVVQLRVGPAADTLKHLIAEGDAGTFDLMFIDADKTGYDAYYELGLRLLRSGGLMLIDNMLWGGDVADPDKTSPDTEALRALARKIHDDKRVDMTLATIGDGLSVVVKR